MHISNFVSVLQSSSTSQWTIQFNLRKFTLPYVHVGGHRHVSKHLVNTVGGPYQMTELPQKLTSRRASKI